MPDLPRPEQSVLTNGLRLITSPREPIGGRVYLCWNGRRRWVSTADRLHDYGLRLDMSVEVSPEDVLAFPKGGDLPAAWATSAQKTPPPAATPVMMREIACCALYGNGVEFGPGVTPAPVPLGCSVRYADCRTTNTLRERIDPGHAGELAPVDLMSKIETMDGIDDAGLEFIIACHVIEHTPNPLLAIQTAFRKLKQGGQLVLVVPDKLRTFDRERPLTPLDHLINDFRDPDPSRDLEHYREWFRLVFPVPADIRDEFVAEKQQKGHDIHFHTWTFESFGMMIEWVNANLGAWKRVWSHPGSCSPDANEFYFVMTK